MTAQVILTNWTVYYDEATTGGGYKQLRWTGTTGTDSLNDIYSELVHLFNDPSTQTPVLAVNATTPMRAVTPTEYQIGAFDTGDDEPWFIDPESIKHITGSSLTSVGWARESTVTTGIVKVPINTPSTNWITSDIGKVVTDGTSSGRLLYFDNTANFLWVRPTDETAANDWAEATASITTTGGIGAASQAGVATTGEMIWSNLFTLGTIKTGTQLYLAQSDSVIDNTEDSGSGSWWSTNHIDILVLTTEQDVLIDKGLLTIYARDYGDLYDFFQVDASAGGRNPIPLNTAEDTNNATSQVTVDAYGITLAYSVDYTADILDGGGSQPYDVVVDCNGKTVQEVYEYFKNINRFGSTAAIDSSGSDVAIPGEQFKGGEVQLTFSASATDWVLPNTVTGSLSGATADIIGTVDDATFTGDDRINISNVKGTFVVGDVLSGTSAGAGTVSAVTSLALNKASPIGVFAGGKLFCSRGVYLTNLGASQGSLYEVIDSKGVTRTQPITVDFTISGLVADTEVRIYKVSDDSVVDGVEDSTSSFTHNYTYTADIPVYVIVHHVEYEYIRIDGLSLTANDQSTPVQQRFDRNYNNP